MAANIAALLDKAKLIHKLPSDYKLALVMGVQQTTLTNYRTGKTLPDARVIRLLCDLTGDDPALMAAQIEEERAKTEDARALWHLVAERLQLAARAGVTAAIFAAVSALAVMGALPMSEAYAATSQNPFTKIYIVEMAHRWCTRLIRRLLAPLVRILRAREFGRITHHAILCA